MAPELSEKRLEVVREMLPGVRRVAALWDPTTGASQVSTTERAARTLKLELHILEARRREDVVGALPLSRRSSLSQLNTGSRQSINGKNMWKQGGLISYGPSLEAVWRQAATLVAKILNGTKPADLPVEEPAKLELAVNARTAKALGITIPTSALIQADQVIE